MAINDNNQSEKQSENVSIEFSKQEGKNVLAESGEPDGSMIDNSSQQNLNKSDVKDEFDLANERNHPANQGYLNNSGYSELNSNTIHPQPQHVPKTISVPPNMITTALSSTVQSTPQTQGNSSQYNHQSGIISMSSTSSQQYFNVHKPVTISLNRGSTDQPNNADFQTVAALRGIPPRYAPVDPPTVNSSISYSANSQTFPRKPLQSAQAMPLHKPALPIPSVQHPVGKSRSSSGGKSAVNLKDRDKFDRDRLVDNDISIPNLQRRRDVVAMKLSLMERRGLVGGKGPSTNCLAMKSHVDHLINEATWMAVDYRQELRWKLRMSQLLATLCQERIHSKIKEESHSISDKQSQNDNKSNVENLKLVSARIANMIEHYWNHYDVQVSTQISSTDRISMKDRYGSQSIPENCPPSTMSNILLLDHQRQSLTKVSKINESGYGCVVTGRRCVGKTTLLVAAMANWLDGLHGNKGIVILFASRKSLSRWFSEVERMLPSRVVKLWLPDETNDTINAYDTTDILFGILEKSSAYAAVLKSITQTIRIAGFVIDLRGCSTWLSSTNINQSDWLLEVSTLIPNTWNRVFCCEDALTPDQLKVVSIFLDPSYIHETNTTMDDGGDDDWKSLIQSSVYFPSHLHGPSSTDIQRYDVTTLFVDVVVGGTVESFAAAQVREEIVAQDMDSLQHLKYYQVMDTLLNQIAFQGENPWILAQALVLLRRVCFHEAFITIGSSRRVPYYHEDNSEVKSGKLGIGLGFGLSQGTLHTGISNESSRYCIHPATEGFCEIIKSSVLPSNFDIKTNHESLKKYMTTGSGDDASCLTKPMSCCFGPGPLSAKLSSPSRFNMNGNFYDSIGSCKLQVLCALIARFSGLRIVIVVSSLDEQLTVHNFLNRLGFDHIYAGLQGSKVNEHVFLDGAGLEASSWLKTQMIVQKFNRTSQTASALMICLKDVFLQPGIIPWKADVVIMLSDDWITPTDIRSCFRLRLTNAGPSGDPVTVVRVVAKGTLEELVARRGSLLNLQSISLSDLFPSFTHTLQSLLSNGVCAVMAMLYRAPAAALVRKIRDVSLAPIANQSPATKFSNPMPSPATTSEDAIVTCAQWLHSLRLGLLFAEYQFSKLGKFVPLQLISEDYSGFDSNYSTETINHANMPITKSIFVSSSNSFSSNRDFFSFVMDSVTDRVLYRYINLPTRQSRLGISDGIGRDFLLNAIVLRLMESRTRHVLLMIDKELENELAAFNEKYDDSDLDVRNLKSNSIGPNAISASEQIFHSIMQPLDAYLYDHGQSLDIMGGSSLTRSAMQFRCILRKSRSKPGHICDQHLYGLTTLQTASKGEYRFKTYSDYPILVSFLEEKVVSKDGTNVKKDDKVENVTSVRSAGGFFASLFKVDLTSISPRLEFDPVVNKETYKRLRNSKDFMS